MVSDLLVTTSDDSMTMVVRGSNQSLATASVRGRSPSPLPHGPSAERFDHNLVEFRFDV